MALNLPMLVSANSLWKNGKFTGFKPYEGRDVALDSSGFVAMKLYGGYRWTENQYADLAKAMAPTWWAQMDFCCEPEIASSPIEVQKRICATVDGLNKCESAAREVGITKPMPVLQGWSPCEYVDGPIYDRSDLSIVGIGSVCRRKLKGRTGLLEVIDAIDRKMPASVMFHLFGVKGIALASVARLFSKRRFSADSISYSYAARVECRESNVACTGQVRSDHAVKWLDRMNDLSTAHVRPFQPSLF